MSRILFAFVVEIIVASCQTQSGIAENFILDIYKAIDIPYAANNPPAGDDNAYSADMNPAPNFPYVAFPLNVCTREGNGFGTGSSSQYTKWRCSNTGEAIYRCEYFIDSTCGGNTACDAGTIGSKWFRLDVNIMSYGDGYCNGNCFTGDIGCTPQMTQTKTKYYMEVGYYKSYQNDNQGCPANALNLSTNLGFEYAATERFATGVCVKQDNAKYILAKCDALNGDLSMYNDASCTAGKQTLISFTTVCDKYDNPDGLPTSFKYFRRLEGCIVNGLDIQEPTPSPTLSPTTYPTDSPTPIPTPSPIPVPTSSPTTGTPSIPPTKAPSRTPTLPMPTTSPTLQPTKSPNTKHPTLTKHPTSARTVSPSGSPSVSPTTHDELKGIKDKVKSFGLMEYAIIIGSVVLLILFCCVCCWCKKKQLKEISKKHSTNRRNQRRKLQLYAREKQTGGGGVHQMVRQTSPGDDQGFTATR